MSKQFNQPEVDIENLQAEVEQLRAHVAELEAGQQASDSDRGFYESLHEAAMAMMQRHEVDDLLEDIITRACRITGTEHGLIYLHDRREEVYRIRVAVGLWQPHTGHIRAESETGGITGLVLRTGQTQVVYDYGNWEHRYQSSLVEGFDGLVGLPLVSETRLIGVMLLGYLEPGRRFTDELLHQLASFADMASIALDNAQLYQQVNENRHFIKRMNEAVPDVLFVYDYDAKRSIYANRPLGTLLGYTPEQNQDMGHQVIDILIHPDDAGTIAAAQNQLQKAPEGAVVEHEFRVKHADDSWRWVRSRNTTFARDDTGRITQSIGVVRDIDDERRMMDDLRQSEERFRLVFESAAVGIVMSKDGYLVGANPEFHRMLGYEMGELNGVHYRELTHPDDLSSQIQLAETDPDNYQVEKRYIRKDGSQVWVRMTRSLVHGLDGIHAMAIIEDITGRKEAEIGLRKSEARFRAFFDVAAVGMVMTREGHLVEVNPAFCRMLGYTADELVNRHVSEISNPDDLKREYEAAEAVLQGRSSYYQLEKRFIHKNGRQIWTRITSSLMPEMEPVRGMGIVENISARKQAEEQLRNSETRFRAVFESAAVGIVMMGPGGYLQQANQAMQTMLGYTEEELQQMRFFDVTHPDDKVMERTLVRQLIETEHEQISYEKRVIRKDGNVIWVRAAGSQLVINGEPRGVGIVEDITAHKQAEAQLRDSESRFRTVFESAAVGLVVAGEKGRLVQVNPAYRQMMGYTEEELLQMHVGDLTHPDDREREWNLVRELNQSERDHYTIEKRVIRKDGSILWARATGSLFNIGGAVRGVGILEDITERKLAEASASESRQMLRTVLDTIPVRVFWKDRDLKYLGANQLFAQDGGLEKPEDLIGKDDYMMAWVEQAELYRADDLAVINSGIPKLNYEEPQTNPDGKTVWLQTSKIPLRNVEGNIIGVLGTYTDITERRQLNENLRLSEERYRLLAANLPNSAILLVDHDLRFILVDGPEIEATGFSKELLEGKTVFESLPAEFLQMVEPNIRAALEGKVFTTELPWGDDAVYSYSYVPLVNSSGEVEMAMILAQNVTERKKAEEDLRASERRFRSLLEVIPVMVVIYQDGEITYINPAGRRLGGFDSVEVTQSRAHETLLTEALQKLITQGGEQTEGFRSREEIQMPLAEGDSRWLDLTFMETTLEGHDVFVGIGIDITERKQAEEKTLALAIERERVELLADFIKNAGHDFRTPLAVINTSLHLLELSNDPDRKAERINAIKLQVNLLNRLVDALLLMVRHDSELPMSMHMIDVNQLLRDGMGRLQEMARKKKQTLSFDFVEGKLSTMANVNELHRAITEVIDNALRYSPEGATIRVETRRGDGDIVVRVLDDGVGISAEDMEHIFDRFYRADEGRQVGGLGLGLAVARRILQRHGGTIEAESVKGEGSTFTIRLPLLGVPWQVS